MQKKGWKIEKILDMFKVEKIKEKQKSKEEKNAGNWREKKSEKIMEKHSKN